MSSNLPPVGPPSGPPSGPPPPPPSFGNPEFLDSGAGGRIPPPTAPPSSGGGGRRKGLLVGGGVIGLAAVAGGAFAAYQVAFASGPQAAEALPASTIGYVSVDLDPSGKQKLEALETLKKFPGFNDNVDVGSDDDLRAKLFEYVQDEGGCKGVDFGDDIEPWLGDRFGFAAVDVGEDLAPDSSGIAPVGVIAIKDADKAEAGLKKLTGCDSAASSDDAVSGSELGSDSSGSDTEGTSEVAGWSIQGDWVVIAESTKVAEAVTDAAEKNPLSEDDDFTKWTEAAGDPGILTAYAAPEAGTFIADAFGTFPLGMGMASSGCHSYAEVAPGDDFSGGGSSSDSSADDFECSDDGSSDEPDTSTTALQDAFKKFGGAAVTVRFADGGLEVESASSVDYLGLDKIYRSDRGDDVVAGLPDDTAIALGVGFDEGWFTTVTDYVDSVGGGMLDIEDALATLETETGLNLPEDAETLAGESAALAIGGDVDFGAFEDDPSDQPLGLKVKGDPDAITGIIDRLLEDPQVSDELKDAFAYKTDDDHVVAGFSDEWSDQLLQGGDLGRSDDYQDVVKEPGDAAAVLYVNFNTGDWLTRAVEADGGDQEVLDNVEPLRALGLSAWTDDDDVSHSVFRLTTD